MLSAGPRKWQMVTWRTTHSKVSAFSLFGVLTLTHGVMLWLMTEEVTLAMEEIMEKEKDLKQLVQTT